MKVAAVVPTCRGFTVPKQTIPVDWYVVHDGGRFDIRGEATSLNALPASFYGSKSDSIRSAGFYCAWRDGADYILTVDDDCDIPLDWAYQHIGALMGVHQYWWMTTNHITRGYPFNPPTSKIAISHGLWNGVQDWCAETRLIVQIGDTLISHDNIWRRIGVPFPQSAMNFGFIRDACCVMYQPAMGPEFGLDRFADIWGGMFAQLCLSLHGYSFLNGGACVYHRGMSDPKVNVAKEKVGTELHQRFWPHVWCFTDRRDTLLDTYEALADHVAKFTAHDYFKLLSDNMHSWASLFR